MRNVICRIDDLSKYTHIDENVFGIDDNDDLIAADILSSLSDFFDQISKCRDSVYDAITANINDFVEKFIVTNDRYVADSIPFGINIECVTVKMSSVCGIGCDSVYIGVLGDAGMDMLFSFNPNTEFRYDRGGLLFFPYKIILAAPLHELSELDVFGGTNVDFSRLF